MPAKYFDYANVFFFDLVMELLKNMGIRKHAIKLIEGKKPLYRPFYALGPVELETLKTYIETYLKSEFIQPSKSPANISILFDKKSDSSFRLWIDYWGLNNNLTIKNW